MPPRALKLGTRRSALARAQSAPSRSSSSSCIPGSAVELVGIETRGDRILDKPLSSVDGKEFFTAEIDAALLAGQVDLTVHSYKDLSLERSRAPALGGGAACASSRTTSRCLRADVPERLAAGHELRVGSSSPRRASFVPGLPAAGAAAANGRCSARVRLVELRGNVDSRLRRLHEPRGSARQLDGIVLAFAGLARLWADAAGSVLLRELFWPLPRMVLPLSAVPAAPAQGALAIECRRGRCSDRRAAARASIMPPTRRAVATERALLGAARWRLPSALRRDADRGAGLGTLLYLRDADADGRPLRRAAAARGRRRQRSSRRADAVKAWDGSRAERIRR